ncbi:hypothetical protein C8R45DRAFT_933583 [Mycena sanguinolenta]|nr:hypothetical protein C8R45DRAFT_933583 [Mycena sanguinolenta]
MEVGNTSGKSNIISWTQAGNEKTSPKDVRRRAKDKDRQRRRLKDVRHAFKDKAKERRLPKQKDAKAKCVVLLMQWEGCAGKGVHGAERGKEGKVGRVEQWEGIGRKGRDKVQRGRMQKVKEGAPVGWKTQRRRKGDGDSRSAGGDGTLEEAASSSLRCRGGTPPYPLSRLASTPNASLCPWHRRLSLLAAPHVLHVSPTAPRSGRASFPLPLLAPPPSRWEAMNKCV